ncbi:unnamed protein product [Rhodiola kirilowii]
MSPKVDVLGRDLVAMKRPDLGGQEGLIIPLLANHFVVKFDPRQRIYHYDLEISPSPCKEVARMIKRKLVEDNAVALRCALPAFDGRRSLYSPVEFEHDRFEVFINLRVPIDAPNLLCRDELKGEQEAQVKLFRISVKLVSKIDGKELSSYLGGNDDDDAKSRQLPQEYLHALDVVLREGSAEKCIPLGRSLYSRSMEGAHDIGGGAVGLRGFFQSLRPTQQGLALNVDLSVTAFHESIGVIPYLQKRLKFMYDIDRRKTRVLTDEERKEVGKALKHMRVFVSHRETVQRFRVHSLTEDVTDDIWFEDRDGTRLRLVSYFSEHYKYDIQYRNLPCLQISRRKPCYLPMELCVICEGQKFMGKLTDDQTVKILKMGCLRPRERKAIIDDVVRRPVGPASDNRAKEFNLEVSMEMTRLTGRVLQPPMLKLGEGGHVRALIPSHQDRHWNFIDSQVFEGKRIERWALISFGGTLDQRSTIPRFISQLVRRCEQLGIYLNKETVVSHQMEPMQLLNHVALLESKLRRLYGNASSNLQLIICVMERKHKGYADLKRIAETSVGVLSQCCLYQNLTKPSSQFLANLALKINAKLGGCTVALYKSFPALIPRVLRIDEPMIFLGADVTHPHPLDDYSPSVAAVVGSMNWPAANKYVSRMKSQTHRQEIIQDLVVMVQEILTDFKRAVGHYPHRIIFFRDGVSETQFAKVLEKELHAIKTACANLDVSYKPPITFSVVQKRHHTRLFPDDTASSFPDNLVGQENIPPGTVVDTVITHPKEFDFFLCSHWGVKGTSRPTHYHILRDENQFTSDELQKLVYSLCFTFMRCTKPVSLVPPAYYAHLAAYRGRLYLDRSEAQTTMRSYSTTLSRSAPPKAAPLPKLTENLKNLMFYC